MLISTIFERGKFPPATVVDLLRSRALGQSDCLAYTYLVNGEAEEINFTYSQLDDRARAIGALLQEAGAINERVLLLYPPGLDYIAAFFGCLYAGAVAVPVYPPRLNQSVLRLQTIASEAQTTVALTTATILSRLEPVLPEAPALNALRWVNTDNTPIESAESWRAPDLESNTLAFLQFTSGSTGIPKGVKLTHENLLHNSAMLSYAFEYSSESHCVSWLPVYHDMGLIGGVLQPLYGGFPCTLMAPVSFLQRPARWLEAISRYKATISGGPNFAYDLCVRKIPPEQRAQLDLSSWSVAFNGAEPIRHETLERFAAAFESCGFQKKAFYPCYGLAEATLIVSGSRKPVPPIIKTVQPRALEHGQVIEAQKDDEASRSVVSSGRTLLDQKVVVVGPETLNECSPDEVGEVWVSGPSVAQGYWNRIEETEQVFHAYRADTGEGPFLRTGDLGFLKDGELFITGRLKDIIIIRGLNHYPQDIELTVQNTHPALRPDCGAVFSIDIEGEERLVVVQEVDHRKNHDWNIILKIIRDAISERHEIQAYAIELVKAGRVPKTSSGKIRRHACRASFLEGSLQAIAEWCGPVERIKPDGSIRDVAARTPTLAPDADAIQVWLVSQIAADVGVEPSAIDFNQPIVRYGLDSLHAIELVHSIQSKLGIMLSMVRFLDSPSIAQLAAEILTQLTSGNSSTIPDLMPRNSVETEFPLSHGQRALWFLHEIAPESAAYNLVAAVRIASEVDTAALRRAFQALVDRHSSLRTTFTAKQGEPFQQVHNQREAFFYEEDASRWDEAALQRRLNDEAHRPFDLNQNLIRVHLLARSTTEYVLLLNVHHIIADFWSIGLIMHELGVLYSAEKTGTSATLPVLKLNYGDYVRWQANMLSSQEGKRLEAYWRKHLSGVLPVLNLPTDRPRPPLQTYKGASRQFKLSGELTRKLKDVSQARQVTLYAALLAAFEVLLYRYTGQEDLLVGSLIAGRRSADLAGLVGYFVNPTVLRADLSGNLTFGDFLRDVRNTWLDALEHQDYPFPLLVERLQPVRDPSRSPLFQVMFTLQKSHLQYEERLALFTLGEEGANLQLGDLSVESLAVEQKIAQFDLTLIVAEMDGFMSGSLQYNTDLFDAETINRMAGHYQSLVEALVMNLNCRVSHLAFLTATEHHQLLSEWNATATEYQRDKCVHQLFEAQVEKTPDAIALICEGRSLTYGELNRKANQLAHHLRGLEVTTEEPVGLCVERSLNMMIHLLGILKAGGAYVPLDPSYPKDRLAFMIRDARMRLLVTGQHKAEWFADSGAHILYLDADWISIKREREGNPESAVTPGNSAYVIYTSGSTGSPKGVMVSHRNVTNFFGGMNQSIRCTGDDTFLAVTSISFDISVLELFWTLTNGARVILSGEQPASDITIRPANAKIDKDIQFSLFYFASNDSEAVEDKYRLLLEGAKFADRNGFTAVWTPERHFHEFGGLYPNPSVVSAALAVVTEQIKIRAGSVVLPLHNAIRIAEEWSLVDNLSKGRVAIAFASGWHSDDFVFFPENYADRKEVMFKGIETVKKLWRGDAVPVRGGAGNGIQVKIFPKPIQSELPIWITAAGSPETFIKAGEIGANVLTHLLGQTIDEVAERIKLYRDARLSHSHDPGLVTLMLHTFVGEDPARVKEVVREPFTDYLRSSIGLIANLVRSLNLPLDLKNMSEKDMKTLLDFAFNRYFETSALFGTPTTCRSIIERLRAIGVDEIACLIDFGVDADSALAALSHLTTLRDLSNNRLQAADYSLAAQAAKYRPTMMQCTPSLMKMLMLNSDAVDSLQSLQVLLLGGEALPARLAKQVKETLPAKLVNMYGPTETTIWSATHELREVGKSVPIGNPIANTRIYIFDETLEPLPCGVSGELYIAGDGLAHGYRGQPALTAERFLPNPFADNLGARLYRTGDLAKYLRNGSIEFLGRLDHQVKIRGFRIELKEIEIALARYPGLKETVVIALEDTPDDKRLVAYIVAEPGIALDRRELRSFLKKRLPEYMVPTIFVLLDALPLTSNGKVNRKALLAPEMTRSNLRAEPVAPTNKIERAIAEVWQEVLKLDTVGIHDNFFDLGGHSLLMAQVQSQLRNLFKKDLPLIKLLEHPTISSLAKHLAQAESERASIEEHRDRAGRQREALKRQRDNLMKARQ